jgi:hypothetical protein
LSHEVGAILVIVLSRKSGLSIRELPINAKIPDLEFAKAAPKVETILVIALSRLELKQNNPKSQIGFYQGQASDRKCPNRERN